MRSTCSHPALLRVGRGAWRTCSRSSRLCCSRSSPRRSSASSTGATGGWVRLFSKSPVRTVADLKAAKLYTTEGDDRWCAGTPANGFRDVPLAPARSRTSSSCRPAPSTRAAAAGCTPSRSSLPGRALHARPARRAARGATVMTETAWNKIAPADRREGARGGPLTEKQIGERAPGLDAKSIDEMKKTGTLKRSPSTAKDTAAFSRHRRQANELDARGSWCPTTCSTWPRRSGTPIGRPRRTWTELPTARSTGLFARGEDASHPRALASSSCRWQSVAAAAVRHREPGAAPFTSHLTLIVGLTGAAIAAVTASCWPWPPARWLPRDARDIAR